MVSVRPARPDDVGEIARIEVDTWRAAYATILPAAVLAGLTGRRPRRRPGGRGAPSPPSPRHHVLVAQEGEWTVGFTALAPAEQLQPDDPSPVTTVGVRAAAGRAAGGGAGTARGCWRPVWIMPAATGWTEPSSGSPRTTRGRARSWFGRLGARRTGPGPGHRGRGAARNPAARVAGRSRPGDSRRFAALDCGAAPNRSAAVFRRVCRRPSTRKPRRQGRGLSSLREFRRDPAGRTGLLRGPRERQLQGLLDGAQAHLRRVGARAARGAGHRA